ncbi:Steroid nuclear receptor, ligand-binding [Melia azedarach]|uniref:Steroid nuclear receptor, ligand-binding n=1 Tax=Melia azedarach TaxID=155640 RepID=A0ACC1Z3B6_MELAZ|nr:Steroid nuclear receptor, ligand-binding [Melia azedarach]
MEPPTGFLATLWNFICFLPYFIGLLLLGVIKGMIFCPVICLIMTVGNSAIILGLLPVHGLWTSYCILRAKQIGPVLKLVICICIPVFLILWLVVGIAGSVIGGALYGFLSPIFATFDAVGEGKTNDIFHCFYDGTWSSVKQSFTVVRDFKDVCFHSYFSVMDDLRQKQPPDGKYYEISLLYVLGAIIAGVLGILVDLPVISVIAILKSPYMLFKGWHRLFHDLIGREGPFLETICVPFAGLAILLWPLAVVGAVLGSILASIFLGAYAGVVVYQESSLWFGLCYIIASLSIYDEYSNDILDMPEGSCFPRPKYRNNSGLSRTSSRAASFSKPSSFKDPPSRSGSIKATIELKPLELLENLFKECQCHGEIMVPQGLITGKDIEDANSNTGSRVVSFGLPAYCLLQALLRSAKANCSGILLSDNGTEITSTNRPKDAFFDWFLNPFLILKDQIKAENLTEAEEDYLGKLVLFCGDFERVKSLNTVSPPESERKRAELDALARRLQGITKSISRYPTFRRHFDNLVKTLTEDLAKKNGGSDSTNGHKTIQRSKSAFGRFQRSFKRMTSSNHGPDQDSQSDGLRDVEIL